MTQIPGNNYEFTQPIQMRFNELISGVRADVAVKIFGDDLDVMAETAEEIEKVLAAVPGAADVKTEQTTGLPILSVNIDRARLARYGLNIAEVQEAVEIAMGGKEAGMLFEGDRRFPIVVRLPEQLRSDLDVMRRIPIPLPQADENGKKDAVMKVAAMSESATSASFIPLGEIAEFKVEPGLNQVNRENGKRRIVTTANVRGRDLARFVSDAQNRIKSEVKIPAGYWVEWGGQFENLLSASKRLQIVVPVALLLIMVLLFTAFGSIKDALLIFTGVPMALTGGILALWLRGLPLSISAGVGFIALSGVAVLNGVVMFTFIKKLIEDGVSVDEAIFRGSRHALASRAHDRARRLVRLRPDGPCHWSRRRSPAPAGDGCHRRNYQFHAAHLARPAGALSDGPSGGGSGEVRLTSVSAVFHNLIGLLADALPWFLGGAILGAALEAFLPTAWAMRWLGSPRASIFHATFAGAILPGCSMTTVPLAAALKARGARLGTLTAFIMISPILSPETIVLTAALLGAKFTIARIVFPVVVTFLMGLAFNALQARRIRKFQSPPGNLAASDLEAGCCADDEPLEGKRSSGQALRRCCIRSGFTSCSACSRWRYCRRSCLRQTSRATCTAASERTYSRPSPGFPYTSAREPKCLLPMACSKPAWELVQRSLSCSVPSAPASPRS